MIPYYFMSSMQFADMLEVAESAMGCVDEEDMLPWARGAPCPYFGYKALTNKDNLHMKHYIIRTLCLYSTR